MGSFFSKITERPSAYQHYRSLGVVAWEKKQNTPADKKEAKDYYAANREQIQKGIKFVKDKEIAALPALIKAQLAYRLIYITEDKIHARTPYVAPGESAYTLFVNMGNKLCEHPKLWINGGINSKYSKEGEAWAKYYMEHRQKIQAEIEKRAHVKEVEPYLAWEFSFNMENYVRNYPDTLRRLKKEGEIMRQIHLPQTKHVGAHLAIDNEYDVSAQNGYLPIYNGAYDGNHLHHVLGSNYDPNIYGLILPFIAFVVALFCVVCCLFHIGAAFGYYVLGRPTKEKQPATAYQEAPVPI